MVDEWEVPNAVRSCNRYGKNVRWHSREDALSEAEEDEASVEEAIANAMENLVSTDASPRGLLRFSLLDIGLSEGGISERCFYSDRSGSAFSC